MLEAYARLHCGQKCWGIAALVGLVLMLLLIAGFGMGVIGAMACGLAVTLIVGVVLLLTLCKELPNLDKTGAAAAPAVSTTKAPAADSGSSEADADAPAKDGTPPPIGAAAATDERATAATDMPEEVTPIGAAAATDERASAATDMPEEVAPIGSSTATDERASAATDMPGEVAPIGAATASGAADAVADMSEDFDKDGVLEGTDEGTKPPTLDGPKDGKADNLKEIKGVGPKLEKMLNEKGIYHFDQVAKWSDQELAWVDANIKGFKGRASRDEWVKQAKILASGGETEFSKRVDEGDVY